MNETLEQYIDMHGLDFVLAGLASVCREKAEHLRSNWQDERSAKQWERKADIVDRAVERL
jgi:hypothetical protein